MIPKVINYIWLSDSDKPEDIMKCIASWKEVLPNYEVREWKMKDFPINDMPVYVKEAISVKKWAFATDYLRLWVLYHEGGIYLDSDILMKKNIDVFTDNGFFSFIEYHEAGFRPYKNLIDETGKALVETHIPGFCMQAAFMGSEKEHEFVGECLEYYNDRHFLTSAGKPDMSILAPDIYALCARKYGFLYKDCLQRIGDRMTIYPSSYVAGTSFIACENNYVIHCCAGSWRDRPPKQKLFSRIKKVVKRCIGRKNE